MKTKANLLAAVFLTSCLSACASTDMGQRDVKTAVVDGSSIEAGYTFESEKIEQKIKQSGARITDPALNNYLTNLTNEIIGDYDGQLRVYALEAPVFNAGILPNGAMVIYSGLMLRAESEAELALVLGHEFGHYYEQHALERRAAAGNANVRHLLFTVGTLGYGGLVSILANTAQYSSFSRENEVEADKIGLKQLASNNYDARSAVKLWENLDAERSVSTNEKVRKRNRKSAIFGTHPISIKRIANLKLQAETIQQSNAKVGKTSYRAKIRPFLQDWLEAELTQRDYGSLFHLLDRLEKADSDLGVINYMRGQTYATRDEDSDIKSAMEAYQAATEYNDVPVATWKQLGDIYTNLGDSDKAAQAFRTYLEKSPAAEDRQLIEYLIKSLGA